MQEIYHFIGIGGIGMSALARILMQRGGRVQGSDARTSGLLDALRSEGAYVQIGHKPEALAGATHVVCSTDIPQDNAELVRAHELKLPILHRSALLDLLLQNKKALLVSGTHGKTTVTALLASVLVEAGFDPSFVIGGIHRHLKTNGRAGAGEYFVAEADESDGSFLKTASFGAIVTNLEDDHLNYWQTSAKLDDAFGQFFAQVKHAKHLFWCGDDIRLQALNPQGVAYGFGLNNALRITSWKATPTGLVFSLATQQYHYTDIPLALFGRHNALNAAAVFGLSLSLGVREEAIRAAFAAFAGTERRLEPRGQKGGVDLYDDYAHHPTEIAATLQALRGKIGERRLVALFQPHRYTRVRDLFSLFAGSFAEADLVVLTDIYSAGEASIDGMTSETLYAEMRAVLGKKLHFFPRAHLESDVAKLLRPHDVLVTLGAGDVTRVSEGVCPSSKLKIALLFGGESPEHAVSLMSARTIFEGLNPSLYDVRLFGISETGHWTCGPDAFNTLEQKLPVHGACPLSELVQCDVAFPMFHGPRGEDGMIQGFLATLNIAHVGCDYRASVLCMHKGWTKQVARACGVPTLPWVECARATQDGLVERIEAEIPYPLWVKGVHLGSSIGVFRVQTREELVEAARFIFALDDALIAEREMTCREIEFSLLGNLCIRVAPAAEIAKQASFHGYDNKYGAYATPFLIPAPLTESQRKIGEELATEMYRAVGCQGLARIDFFLDGEGHFWLNEINPMPGFTKTSAFPQMWGTAGLAIPALCDELVVLALARHRSVPVT